mgnify:CR=1 FL=1|jgi:hypothetical protein
MDIIDQIMARIKYRYNCDEHTARAILGSRIQRDQAYIKVMLGQPKFSPAMQGKLEEVERFFAESPDEILCCPYAPASDRSVDALQRIMASIGRKVPYYENCSQIRSGIGKLAWRFTMRGPVLCMKGTGKPVEDTGKFVQIFPGTAKGKKVWRQRKTVTFPISGKDELYPSARRLKEIITDQQHWFEDYKVTYREETFSGMEVVSVIPPEVRLVFPVRINSVYKARNEDLIIRSESRPIEYAPMMAMYAAWLYSTFEYPRPNKPLTALRPDGKMVQSLVTAADAVDREFQKKLTEAIAESKKFRRKYA